jgi:2-amino-4-hydroxy-6-hydroxymethyldihydropteridine diphosphokinase
MAEQKPVEVFIALGSNIDPQNNIPSALLALKTYLPITAISNFYKTRAVSRTKQPDFFNGVVKIQTGRSPREIKFNILRNIEQRFGRVRSADKFTARTIDLDMILYGSLVVNEPDLHLPDPSIRIYPFVAIPLLELALDLVLPDTRTLLCDEPVSRQKDQLQLLPEFTDRLRRLILP